MSSGPSGGSEDPQRYSTLGPRPHSQDNLPESEALRRQGSDLEHPALQPVVLGTSGIQLEEERDH